MSDVEAKIDALFELVQYLVEREEEREKNEKFELEKLKTQMAMAAGGGWNDAGHRRGD